MKNQRHRRRKRSTFPLLALLFAIATLAAAGTAFAFLGGTEECLIRYEGEHSDERAQKINIHFLGKNKSNKEGDFSYEIRKDLVFKGEDQKCRIDLVNPFCNNYLMYAEIEDENNEVFFRSGLLCPGEKIKTITPDVPLKEGTFKGYASICAVDPATEEFLGFLEQELTIEVRK